MLKLATDRSPAVDQAEAEGVLLRRTMVDLRKSAKLPNVPGHAQRALEAAADLVEQLLTHVEGRA
jgi:hypothetical protein